MNKEELLKRMEEIRVYSDGEDNTVLGIACELIDELAGDRDVRSAGRALRHIESEPRRVWAHADGY